MLRVKTPQSYLNEPGLISKVGEHIAYFGKKPLIIGGRTAIEAVGNKFWDSLKENAIDNSNVYTFTGYPSQRQFEEYANIADQIGADMIIGIGGGRVLDTSKAVGDINGLPVLTVPTVAATCAAWAAVTIQYDDEGAFVTARSNKNSPVLVAADPKVIFTAPKRYLFSGVVDTFAKFYETRPAIERFPDHITTDIGFYASQIAVERLKESAEKAYEDAHQGIYEKAAKDTIDAIIYLAGFVGSFQEDLAHYSFAHPFYHISTRLAHTRILLHGEKVAFGIVAQLFLEKRAEEEIIDVIHLFEGYHAAFTFDNLGIKENTEADIAFLAKDIVEEFPYVPYNEAEIKEALMQADRLTRKVKGELS